MALHPELPRSPCAELDPAHRWFPADEALRSTACEQPLPPRVDRIRTELKAWRDSNHAHARRRGPSPDRNRTTHLLLTPGGIGLTVHAEP